MIPVEALGRARQPAARRPGARSRGCGCAWSAPTWWSTARAGPGRGRRHRRPVGRRRTRCSPDPSAPACCRRSHPSVGLVAHRAYTAALRATLAAAAPPSGRARRGGRHRVRPTTPGTSRTRTSPPSSATTWPSAPTWRCGTAGCGCGRSRASSRSTCCCAGCPRPPSTPWRTPGSRGAGVAGAVGASPRGAGSPSSTRYGSGVAGERRPPAVPRRRRPVPTGRPLDAAVGPDAVVRRPRPPACGARRSRRATCCTTPTHAAGRPAVAAELSDAGLAAWLAPHRGPPRALRRPGGRRRGHGAPPRGRRVAPAPCRCAPRWSSPRRAGGAARRARPAARRRGARWPGGTAAPARTCGCSTPTARAGPASGRGPGDPAGRPAAVAADPVGRGDVLDGAHGRAGRDGGPDRAHVATDPGGRGGARARPTSTPPPAALRPSAAGWAAPRATADGPAAAAATGRRGPARPERAPGRGRAQPALDRRQRPDRPGPAVGADVAPAHHAGDRGRGPRRRGRHPGRAGLRGRTRAPARRPPRPRRPAARPGPRRGRRSPRDAPHRAHPDPTWPSPLRRTPTRPTPTRRASPPTSLRSTSPRRSTASSSRWRRSPAWPTRRSSGARAGGSSTSGGASSGRSSCSAWSRRCSSRRADEAHHGQRGEIVLACQREPGRLPAPPPHRRHARRPRRPAPGRPRQPPVGALPARQLARSTCTTCPNGRSAGRSSPRCGSAQHRLDARVPLGSGGATTASAPVGALVVAVRQPVLEVGDLVPRGWFTERPRRVR